MNHNTDFSSMNLSPGMVQNLTNIGFKTPTPIQSQSLPYTLKNVDVMGQAKTGSGKTAAFGIGILEKLKDTITTVQALVLCPTRELADQVAEELRRIASFKLNTKILTLCGGVPFRPQKESLTHHAQIIVGTPGRVLKHLQNQNLTLSQCKTLVLDEGDRMLDMGFSEEIQNVINYVPTTRQTLLFSATFSSEIQTLCERLQQNTQIIKTIASEEPNPIQEIFYETEMVEKPEVLFKLLAKHQPQNVLIFCEMKSQTEEVVKILAKKNIPALALNGNLEQFQRTDVLTQFTNGSCRCLVATDVAARGLDIKELSLVLNYTLPQNYDTYIHRIGRTARAGQSGLAITFCTPHQKERLQEFTPKEIKFEPARALRAGNPIDLMPLYQTVVIEGGKKHKIRAGDVLGSFTGEGGIAGSAIGNISIKDKQTYVAVLRSSLKKTLSQLKSTKIKGKKFPIWALN